MTQILITGACGFAGRSLLAQASQQNYIIRATYHHSDPAFPTFKSSTVKWIKYDLGAVNNDYSSLLEGVDVVIHLAARVHVSNAPDDELTLYRKINTQGTRILAEEAAIRGVKRFIYISTIKVNGEKTLKYPDGRHLYFSELDAPAPADPYAISKLEAEHEIKKICATSSMTYIILRPPLIYGPYVKANFLRLIQVIEKGLPLPLASIRNMRSILYVENLVDAILAIAGRPEITNQTYLISDTNIPVPELVSKIACHLGKRQILFPCPVFLLKMAGWLSGKKAMMARLTDSLLVDSSKLVNELNWNPHVSMDEGLARTIKWYRDSQKK